MKRRVARSGKSEAAPGRWRWAPGWAARVPFVHVSRVDLALALSLALATLALRWPFQAEALYAWDSVLYARALERFNVLESRPHPPGYLFYVELARAAYMLVGDANRALVLVSLLGSALAVAGLALYGSRLLGRGPALVAAGLLASSPLFLFYSDVAYPYTLLAAGASLLVWLVWRSGHGKSPGSLALGLALGAAGGFRLDLTLFLLPAALWALKRRGDLLLPGLARFGVGLGLGCATWFVPSALLSNGLAAYTAALLGQADYVEDNYSLAGHGWLALERNGAQVVSFTWQALGWALLPAAYAVGRGWRHPARTWLALWVLPPVLFFTLVHIGDRGYIFSYLPALCLMAGWGVFRLADDFARLAGRFRRLPSQTPAVLGGGLALVLMGGLVGHFLTDRGRHGAYELSCFSRGMAATVSQVRASFRPEETLLFSSFYYQHALYLLPEYRSWRFDPVKGPNFENPLPPEIAYVVAFGEDVGVTPSPNRLALPLPCGRNLYVYEVNGAGMRLAYRHSPPLMYVGN